MLVLGVLLVARWFFPPQGTGTPAVVEAVQRQAHSVPPATSPKAKTPVSVHSASSVEANAAAASAASGADGSFFINAFAARVSPVPPTPAPPPPPPQPVQAMVAPVMPVEVTPQVPPPPLEVIGTWNDGVSGPSLFFTTPQGTAFARMGTVLMSEYRVMEIASDHVTLAEVASQREWRLPIPKVGTTP
jgi:hypothetical protein